jgi:deoxyribodipyrimidine photolyase-like uncharacterized protein
MGYLTARLEHDLSSLVTDRGEQLTAVVAVVAVLGLTHHLERLNVVRSASLVSEILPDINSLGR